MTAMRAMRVLSVVALVASIVRSPLPALAQEGLRVVTPYPAVAVEPGENVTFRLEVTAPEPVPVDLSLEDVPEGWSATLRGGGFVIGGVFADPDDPPEVRLEVEVPAQARPGVYTMTVTASSPLGTDSLDLELGVSREVGGSLSLAAEFPSLRGPSDATFVFDLELTNDTPEATTFGLEAVGPEGWQVEARPTGEQQAATVTVAAGESAAIQVEVDPPNDAVAGVYPIAVRAAGGERAAVAELEVEITGNFAMTLTTPDERFDTEAQAGRTAEVAFLVVNEGTAPLVEVQLSATPPTNWDVEFRPETIDLLPPGQATQVTALITPAGDAVAGDYVVTVQARVPEVSDEVDLRTTVKTSSLWGAVGIALIIAALAGLGWVFRRYGRR